MLVRVNVLILVVLQHYHHHSFQKVINLLEKNHCQNKKDFINYFCFLTQLIDICSLDEDRGSCNNMTTKYFYDRVNGVCRQFMYGGCGGNENRFSSKKECEQQCYDTQGK